MHTCMHSFRPRIRFGSRLADRAWYNTTFRIRLGVSVRAVCSTQCFSTLPGTSLLTVRPRIEAATRDDGAEVFGVLGAELI